MRIPVSGDGWGSIASCSRPAQGPQSHPLLRPARWRHPQGASRTCPRTARGCAARCSRAAGRTGGPIAVPVLQGAWSSSKPLGTSVNPAHRRPLRHCRDAGVVTRHGPTIPDPAACMPAEPTPPVPIVVKEAITSTDAEPSVSATRRRHPDPERPHLKLCPYLRCRPTPDQIQSRNPHSHRLWPASSGLQNFRMPAGIRNCSGERNDRFPQDGYRLPT